MKEESWGQEDVLAHQVTSTTFSHTHLWEAAKSALQRSAADGDPHDALSALVLAAFSLEAYVNFVCSERVQGFSQKANFPSKWKALCEAISFQPNCDERPFGSIAMLRELRNAIAHATTETITECRKGPPPSNIQYPAPSWQLAYEHDRVAVLLEDVEAAITEIHAHSGLQRGRLGMLGDRGGEVLRRRMRPGEA